MKRKIEILLLTVLLGTAALIPAREVWAGQEEGGEGSQNEAVQEESQEQNPLMDVTKASVARGTWEKSGQAVMFRYRDGTYARDIWHKIRGKIYYFDRMGRRAKGWLTYRGRRYYLGRKGAMQTGWITYRKRAYYLNRKGVMVSSQWVRRHGKEYYLKANGQMATGWLKLGKKRYYMGKDGARVTGVQWIGDKWYYFRKNGTWNPHKKLPDVNPKKPMIALTFDDGPGPYTKRLLGYLKENGARATFFLVGSSVNRYPGEIKTAYQMGCEIGNHSYSHPSLTGLTVQGVKQEIERTNTLVRNVTGANPTLVRPPYGAYNSMVCANAELPVILWSVDTRDWETRNAAQTVRHIQTHVRDGDIILMHDIHSQTVDAARQIIPWLQSRGYQLVTVSELAKYKGISLKKGGVYGEIR